MSECIKLNAWWTKEADLQLVEYITKLSNKRGCLPSNLNPCELLKTKDDDKMYTNIINEINDKSIPSTMSGAVIYHNTMSSLYKSKIKLEQINPFSSSTINKGRKKEINSIIHELSQYPLLLSEYRRQNYNPLTFRLRFSIIRKFNVQLSIVVKMIDLMDTSATWSLGYRVNHLTDKVFLDSKLRLLDKAITETTVKGDSNVRITLDNNKAFASQNRAERFDRDKDPSVSECLFTQLCKELNNKNTKSLQHTLDSKGRLFHVTFRGDEGTDWGGLYRETLARATSDLFAKYFKLNIPCPNRVQGQADNVDKFLPVQTSPSAITQYEFVGKLMGIALRTKNYLEFQYPPIIWKLLVGQTPLENDITSIDTTIMNHLMRIRNCSNKNDFLHIIR